MHIHRFHASDHVFIPEALPTCVGTGTEFPEEQSCVWRDGNELCMRLLCRKNMQRGSGIIRRACCCPARPIICPVHTLWVKFLEPLGTGAKPWAGISPHAATERIRAVLTELKVEDAHRFRTQDLRRGHAQVRRRSWQCHGQCNHVFAYRICCKTAAHCRRFFALDNGAASPSSSILTRCTSRRRQRWRSASIVTTMIGSSSRSLSVQAAFTFAHVLAAKVLRSCLAACDGFCKASR